MSIVFDKISKTFTTGFRKNKVTAVSELNLSIASGETFGIVGSNGAGKSTIIKMIMNFIRPDSGDILLLGFPPSNPQIRFKIGYLPENPYFYDHLSVEELLKFGARTSNMNSTDTNKSITRLLKLMNLEHAGNRRLRNYSKGMIQRAGICFAMIHNPELIILDEPMSGLDPIGRKLFVDFMLKLKAEKKTLLFCSHILNDVERLCDRVAIMDKGKIKLILTKKDLLTQQNFVTLSVKSIPDALSQKLGHLKIKIKNDGELQNILSPKKEINKIISLLSDFKIDILGINPASNSLETIFLNTIINKT